MDTKVISDDFSDLSFGCYEAFVLIWSVCAMLVVEGQSVFMVFGNIDSSLNMSATMTNYEFHSVVDEWNLTSKSHQKYKATLITSSQLFGMAFGYFFGGKFSDIYGRKFSILPLFLASCLTIGVSGMCQSWQTFMAARFAIGLACGGTISVAMILQSEMLPHNLQTLHTILPFSLSHIYMAEIARYAGDWRRLSWFSLSPALLALGLYPQIRESRLYVSECRRTRNESTSNTDVAELIDSEPEHRVPSRNDNFSQFLASLWKSPLRRGSKSEGGHMWQYYAIGLGWFTMTLNFMAMLYHVGSLSGNTSDNLIYVELIRLGLGLGLSLTDKLWSISRKVMYISGLTVLVMCHVGVITVFTSFPKATRAVQGISIVGTSSATVLLAILIVITVDLFSTKSRNGGYGAMLAISRIGGVVAPQVFLLETFSPSVPYAVLLFAALANFLCFIFLVPDTIRPVRQDEENQGTLIVPD